MAGGNFIDTNKALVGAYINFTSRVRPMGQMATRGVVAAGLPLSWGNNEILSLTESQFLTKTKEHLGVSYIDDSIYALRELFAGASSVLLYNLNVNGVKARAVVGNLEVVAVKNGVLGNKIQVEIVENINNNYFTVYTYFDKKEVDKQSVKEGGELKENAYVSFGDMGIPMEEASLSSLLGGEDGSVTSESYSMFLDALEGEQFNTLVCNTSDEIIKNMFLNYTKLARDEKGLKFVTVVHNKGADYEGVINLYNNCVDNGKSIYDGVYWVAGQSAGAQITDSLTYKVYDGELKFNTSLTDDELKELINGGKFVLRSRRDTQTGSLNIIVEQDINSFTSFAPTKNKDFSNNKIVRILDQLAIDVSNIFINIFVKNSVANSDLGRSQLKGEIVYLLNKYDSLDAIESFDTGDVSVTKGAEKGDVISNIAINPIGAMEKLYLSVEVI